MNDRRPLVSVVIPVYYNAETLLRTGDILAATAEANPAYRFEFLFVDDGSGDGSWEMVRQLATGRLEGARGLRLARNFGSHMATLAGYRECSGDLVCHVNADLQEPPDLVSRLLRAWERHRTDVVLAVRRSRPEGFSQRLFARLYYEATRRLVFPRMPAGGFDCYLMTRHALDSVLAAADANSSLPGVVLWSGHSIATLPYDRQLRPSGRSRWTLAKKVKLIIDTIVPFSYTPIRLMSLAGCAIALASFLYAGWVLYRRLAHRIPVEGWASLMVVVLLVSGIQLIALGIVGEYLWRTYDAARQRPCFVVDERVGPPDAEGDG